MLLLVARQSLAEMWCGDGPGTALSHPCTDDDDSPAVSDAIAKYQDQWIQLDGVWSIREGDIYENRVADIEVHVEPASMDSVRKQIPPFVDGIPVVLVPGKTPDATGGFSSFSVRLSSDPAENARRAEQERAQQEKDRARAEDLYNSCTAVMQKYRDVWDSLPGVTGMGAKCDGNHGCDFTTIQVTVQRELLPEARREIPDSVDGVRIVLTPLD